MNDETPPLAGRRSPDFGLGVLYGDDPNAKVPATSSKTDCCRSRSRRGTQISVTSGVDGWRAADNRASLRSPMLRGVCIAITASANVGTAGDRVEPRLVVGPVRKLAEGDGSRRRIVLLVDQEPRGDRRSYPTGSRSPQPRRRSCTVTWSAVQDEPEVSARGRSGRGAECDRVARPGRRSAASIHEHGHHGVLRRLGGSARGSLRYLRLPAVRRVLQLPAVRRAPADHAGLASHAEARPFAHRLCTCSWRGT